MATRYCCYLLDIDRIATVCIIECEDDAAALQEAGPYSRHVTLLSGRGLGSQSQAVDHLEEGRSGPSRHAVAEIERQSAGHSSV